MCKSEFSLFFQCTVAAGSGSINAPGGGHLEPNAGSHQPLIACIFEQLKVLRSDSRSSRCKCNSHPNWLV